PVLAFRTVTYCTENEETPLGNVVDRVRIGAVVDYLDLHWRGMHWPAFNLADIFIVGSAALLVLASFGPRADSRGDDRGDAT
uniref:signal peptidase II n=1 Tax=uncultured Piscinibacter sp. TaxID=1131835 RepID=UPI002634352D